MYIEINNPNDYIRNTLCNTFNNFDFSDIEVISDVVDKFQNMHNFDPKIYNMLIKSMYQCYFIERKSNNQKYKNCVDDTSIYEHISNDPYFIIEMLLEVFNFCNKSFLKRRETISKVNGYKEDLININALYIFDLLEYTRPIIKEDLLHIYYEEDSELENVSEFDRFFYTQDKVEDFIYLLYSTDIKNYFLLATQILEEGYYLLKHKCSLEKAENFDEELIKHLENTPLEDLKELMMEEEHLLSDILYYFIEYNNLSDEEQEKIKTKIKFVS